MNIYLTAFERGFDKNNGILSADRNATLGTRLKTLDACDQAFHRRRRESL
jgi:hypothetical protein